MPRYPRDDGWSGGSDWRGDGNLGGDFESAGGGGTEVSNKWPTPKTPTPTPAPAPAAPAGGEDDFAAKQRETGERDEDSYSKDQWSAWDEEEKKLRAAGKSASQLVPGGCPPHRPYTSRPGPDGKVECAFKPDDCPDGTHVVGTPGKCVPGAPGSEYGQGGGGGGTGGGSSASSSASAPVKQKKIVDYNPQRDQVYGGGTLAVKPGGAQFGTLAGGTPPQPTSQQILGNMPGKGTWQPGLGAPTATTGGNMYTSFPGSATTGQEAVSPPAPPRQVADSLLWPSGFGGL